MSVSRKIVHGRTLPGSCRPAGQPGSRVTDRISCGVPMPPATITSCAARKSFANRRLNPTCNGTPAALAASIARSASAGVRAIGFSQNTAFPASAAATTRSAWAAAIDVIATASIAGSSSSSAVSVVAFTPYGVASRSAAPGAGSATAASSAPATRWARLPGVHGADPAGPDQAHADDPQAMIGPSVHRCSSLFVGLQRLGGLGLAGCRA